MAVKTMPYQNLNHALKLFRSQVMEGVPYAQENLPRFTSPEQIFNWLKLRTTYKNDPKGTELFQTLPTLLDDNYHGLTGSGDCDCFTIAALSVLLANGFTDCGIVLVGRKSWQPVHIYAYVVDDSGEKKYLDLTNRVYNYERPYPYKQHIKFKLNPKEKRAMMLQLADNGNYNGYIWMPSQGVQLREDLFDDLSESEFRDLLLNEGYEFSEAVELAGRWRTRRDEKRADRRQRKKDKMELKKTKVDSKADKRRAKGRAAETKAEAKRLKGEKGGTDWGAALTTVTDTAGNLIGKWKGTDRVPDDTQDMTVTDQVNGNKPAKRESSETVSILGMEVSKPVAYIGGGLLVLGIGYGIYKATRPKRKAA
ncbi:MAG: hypothetical protein EKK64_01020 [Neisseriaceae bacterium]|nr:MAG: hypothetical protein EKK64_01020 [Neisseriaceae bacterium]